MGSELTTYRVNQLCGPTVCIFFPICERILENGPLCAEAEFLFLIVRNFKAVIATGLKPGIAILQSLNYTRCKFRTPPTSGLGVATQVQLMCCDLYSYCNASIVNQSEE